MKPKLLFMALLLGLFSTAAFAQNQGATSKTIRLHDGITSLVVNDDVTVILTQSKTPEVIVEGDAKAVLIDEADEQISVSASNGRSAVGTKVYMPAAMLSKVYLNGAGTLRSASTLSNRKLKIFLSAEAKIQVKSLGNVTVETGDNVDFVKES